MLMTNHWQNNHRTVKGRHHACSGNTAEMCGTGIRHRSSNTSCEEKLQRGEQWSLLLVDAGNAFNKLNRKVSVETSKNCVPYVHIPTQHLQHTHHATSEKMGTTHCHRMVWHKGTMQQWQWTPYPHDHWYKHWAMKLQMMKWNRYGMQMIALQSDHWQE